MTALVIAEHENGQLKPSTLNTVTAALQTSSEVHVLVAGAGCASVAQAAAGIAGVAKVLHADAPQLEAQTAENVAEQVLALASGYTHMLAPATAFGKNVAPRIAARLDVAQLSDIIAVNAPDSFTRPIYAGNAIATVQSLDARKVITVRRWLDGSLHLFWRERELVYSLFTERPPRSERTHTTPKANHPWRLRATMAQQPSKEKRAAVTPVGLRPLGVTATET